MSKLRKLANNFDPRAIGVLGVGTYARYLLATALRPAAVIRAGDLKPIDMAMGRIASRFRLDGREFTFDCRFADETIDDGTYAFGVVRELYVRDCYFRHHAPGTRAKARTVLDLGANRGAFSAMMTPFAETIVSVEVNDSFVPVIRHNLDANGAKDAHVVCAYVGAGGAVPAAPGSVPTVSIPDLLNRHGIGRLDFMKMDIEGSEFAMYADPAWLDRVAALSMELHPEFGDPAKIIDALRSRRFTVTLADENLHVVTDPANAYFLYARHPGATS